MKRLVSTAGVLLFALSLAALYACSDGLPSEFPAPDFAVKGLFDGKDVRLSEMRNRPVILYFFASW